ncbi:MAG: hypothetical protein ACYTEQ_27390 [Planctomycetota bacterium]
MSGLDLIGRTRATEEEARQADRAEMGGNLVDCVVIAAVVIAAILAILARSAA